MSDVASALGGARFEGFATVEEFGPVGMITLRGALDAPAVQAAVRAAVGVDVPAPRRIEMAGDKGAGWMSPDELLLTLPYGEVPGVLASLVQALAGEHALVVDVSDARAVFRIRGPQAREVLMKLCPVDLAPASFGPGELRRTRAAQVAAAFWISGAEEFTLVSFRSVAGYVFGLLANAAAPGGEIGVFAAPTA